MRYLIIGAGGVGGTIGGKLHQSGHHVTLVARGPHLDALRTKGLRLVTPTSEDLLDLPTVAEPGDLVLEPDTVLILAVKSQDTAQALATWSDTPVVGGGVAGTRLPLVCAQNGVANERAALRWFQRVYPMCVWLPATFLEPGIVMAGGQPHAGMLHLGTYPRGRDETAQQIADELIASGFLAPVHDDVMRWKYGKLVSNLGNAFDALLGDNNDEDLVDRARAEGKAALAAAGIQHSSPAEEATLRADQIQGRAVPGYPAGRGSTWQSLARGAGSVEVDYLNGEILVLGRVYGIPTPANLGAQLAMQAALRRGIEAGKFPLDELRALIGPATD